MGVFVACRRRLVAQSEGAQTRMVEERKDESPEGRDSA